MNNFHFAFKSSIKFAIVFVALVGMVCARGPGHHGGGGGSGEHSGEEEGGRNCTIAQTGTTNCTGVTGANCSDSANLKVSFSLKFQHFFGKPQNILFLKNNNIC
jgi:hypothetical protein